MRRVLLFIPLLLLSVIISSSVIVQASCNEQHFVLENDYCNYYDWRNAFSFDESVNIRMRFSDLWNQKNCRELIYGYDPLDMPCMAMDNLLMQNAIVGWNDDWIPHGYSLDDCTEFIIPQLWEEPLSLQDLTALYLFEPNTCEDIVPEMSVEDLLHLLAETSRSPTDVLIQNIGTLSALAGMQSGRRLPLQDSIKVDLDNDGTEETVELVQIKAGTLNEYHLVVNGKETEVFYNTNLSAEVIDFKFCKIICVYPRGISDRNDLRRSNKTVLFGYFAGDVRFLGAIQGDLNLFIGGGLFLTLENIIYPDKMYGNAVSRRTYIYGITADGLLFRVSQDSVMETETPLGWQQQNDVWKLRQDMPLYKCDGATLSDNTLKKGTRVIIRGSTENGYLYVCDENGIGGVIRLICPELEPQDPYAVPGGRRLSKYLTGYDSYAYPG